MSCPFKAKDDVDFVRRVGFAIHDHAERAEAGDEGGDKLASSASQAAVADAVQERRGEAGAKRRVVGRGRSSYSVNLEERHNVALGSTGERDVQRS